MASNNNDKSILSMKAKSFRLNKIKDKDGNYLKNTGIFPYIKDRTAYFPITSTIQGVTDFVYSLFGTEVYGKYCRQFFYPKRITFKPKLIPGPQRIINTEAAAKKAFVKQNLPKLPGEPGFKRMNFKGTIVDYTKALEVLMFRDKKLLNREVVRKYIKHFIPEYITYFVIGDMGMDLTKIQHVNSVNILANSPTRDYFTNGYERVIFGFKVTSKNPTVFSIPYLSGSSNLPKSVYLDPDTIYLFSLIQFILRTYCNERDEDLDSAFNDWMEYLKSNNCAFYFYNDNFAFAVDLKQIGRMKWNTNKFMLSLKSAITMLVKNNVGEIPTHILAEQLEARDAEEKEEFDTDIDDSTEIETKKGVTAQNITTPDFPDYTKVQDMEIAKIVNNIIKTKQNSSITYASMATSNKSKFELKEELSNDEGINFNEGDFASKIAKAEAKNAQIMKLQNKTNELLDPDLRNISEDSDINIVGEDDEVPENLEDDRIVDDEEFEEAELEQEEQDLRSEFDQRVEDIEDHSDAQVDIELESEKQLQEELTEEEKVVLLKTIEEETKPKKSPKEIARIKTVREKYKSIKLDDNRTLSEIIEDTQSNVIERDVKELPNIKDKSLQYNNVVDLEKSYVEKTMRKDIVKTLKSFSNDDKTIPLHILDVDIVDNSDAYNDVETYVIKFEDETQKRHTLKFDVPKVDENGRIKINGNYKILKKQLILKPIVKLGPDSVWITTQFNKVLLSRSGNTLNRSTHILRSLLMDELQANKHVKIAYGNANMFNGDYITNVEYDTLAEKFVNIDIYPNSEKNRIYISFNQQELRTKITTLCKNYTFKDNVLPIGIDFRGSAPTPIEIPIKNKKSSVSAVILDLVVSANVIPDLDQQIARVKVPRRRVYTEICLQSRNSPLIVFLGALFGLANVINKYQCRIQLSEKPLLKDRRPFIKFKDVYMYYEDYPLEYSLLLNGLTKMKTEEYTIEEMNDAAPYLEFLYKEFKTTNIYKGWTSFRELFLDPVTIEILQDLMQPTDFLEVFLYANDLLGDNQFFHETDLRNYRVRGYEMVNEYLYKALATQYITLKQMKNPAKLQFSVPQDAVVAKLYKSPLLANCDITNPLNELKEKSIVSYKGTSGVNLQQAFKMEKRAYGSNAMGVIGIASVDNAQVGITKELTMDCNIINTRGYIETIDEKKDAKDLPYSKMCTVEESFFPYMMLNDDPNRIGFACNQTIHTEEVDGSAIGLVGTGTDKVLAYKAPSTFAAKAKEDGKVVSIDEDNGKILVEYKSGKKEVISYGVKLNRNSNFFFENDLTCAVKPGQTIKKNDILTYNKNFFEFEGKDIFFKMGTVANVAIFDGSYTDEDSTLVSHDLSERMGTNVALRKQISLSKTCNLIKYCKIGDHVNIGDPLMIFEDTFDESSSVMLDQLGTLTESEKAELLYKIPKANGSGTIIDIDVAWTVPLEEMRPSLRAFVEEYKKKITKLAKQEKDFTGKESKLLHKTEITVPNKDRIEGALVPEGGGVVISYFISHRKGLSVGDKISIHTSIKSIIAKVTTKEESPYRENGPVDLITSYIGISKRQVNSIYMAGGIGKILYDYGKRIARKYLNEKNKK